MASKSQTQAGNAGREQVMKNLVKARAWVVAHVLALGLMLTFATSLSAQVRLDLRDADLRSFVEIVAEATGRNYVLDPSVRGTVTVLATLAALAALAAVRSARNAGTAAARLRDRAAAIVRCTAGAA